MNSEIITIIDDERAIYSIEFFNGLAFLHFQLRLWNKTIAKAIAQGIMETKAKLRTMGYTHINIIIPDNDAKLYRFCRKFGFNELLRESGQIRMYQE